MPIDAPLTYGQLSTWRSIETFATDRLMEVNVPAVWEGLAGLSREQVLDALRRLTERHEALRTTFHLVDGRPVQRIHDRMPLRVEEIELPGRDPGAPARVLGELYRRAFPVTDDPGWHGVLALVDGRPEFLAVTFSHLVVDVWAIRELELEFRELAAGGPELGPSASPRELALLQHGESWAGRRRSAERHWAKVLEGGPLRNFPAPPARPSEHRIQATLSSHRLAALTGEAAAALSASPQSVLTAMAAAALAGVLDRDRVLLSVMCANRFDPQWQSAITTMNQLIPLVCPVPREATVAAFVKRLHFNAMLAYRNGSYDVDRAAELAGPHLGSDGRGFEHDAWFNYVSGPGLPPSAEYDPLARLTWSPPPRDAGQPFYLRVNGDGKSWTELTLRVDPDLVPAGSLVAVLRTIAAGVLRAATDPESTIGSLLAAHNPTADNPQADGLGLPPELFPREAGVPEGSGRIAVALA